MRGEINYQERAKQQILFSGMRWGTKSPTDFDGVVDIDDTIWVIFEIKLKGVEIPTGQRIALERAIDNFSSAFCKKTNKQKVAICFLAEHTTPVEDPVMAIDCVVTRYYYCGEWKETTGNIKLGNAIDGFIGKHK